MNAMQILSSQPWVERLGWTLVHFLLHGAKGARRAAFEEYARAEARGAGGYDTFVRLFGPDVASLEAAWHRYEEDL